MKQSPPRHSRTDCETIRHITRSHIWHIKEKTAMNQWINPEETQLQGYWIDVGSTLTPDSNWERIRLLTGEYLELLATTSDGREQLYRDPDDGRLWELVPVDKRLPAGPPLLRVILPPEAKAKYDVDLT